MNRGTRRRTTTRRTTRRTTKRTTKRTRRTRTRRTPTRKTTRVRRRTRTRTKTRRTVSIGYKITKIAEMRRRKDTNRSGFPVCPILMEVFYFCFFRKKKPGSAE